jgi:FlgD Ig-like domain
MHSSRIFAVLTSSLIAAAMLPALPALAAPRDRTPPTLQITGVRNVTFFPADDGYKDVVQVTYQVSDDSADPTLNRRVQISDSRGQVVLERSADVATPGSHSFPWDGRNAAGRLQPKGDYHLTFTVTDSSGNASTARSRAVTLSPKRIVTRTFRRTVGAAGSTVHRQVGRCSSLRKPSLHGWAGSLGYYSNTRCRSRSQASVAATVNAVYVPRAFRGRYGSLKVLVYGGAARTRPHSRAGLDYWNRKRRDWVGFSFMSSAVRSHSGKSIAAGPIVNRNPGGRPSLAWGFLTAASDRFDVKTFTVVLRYQLLR